MTLVQTEPKKIYIRVDEQWWQPWANTLCYYNINDNDTNTTIYDLSWNWKNLTWSSSPSYVTDTTYGRCAYFNGSNYASLWWYLNPNSTQYTLIGMFNGNYDKCIVSQGSSNSRLDTIRLNSNGGCTCQNPADVNSYLDLSSPITADNWYMLCLVRDWNTFYSYINWQYSNQKTYSSVSVDWTSWWYWQLWATRQQYDKYTWKIKMVIFENKAWTSQEIADLAAEYGF